MTSCVSGRGRRTGRCGRGSSCRPSSQGPVGRRGGPPPGGRRSGGPAVRSTGRRARLRSARRAPTPPRRRRRHCSPSRGLPDTKPRCRSRRSRSRWRCSPPTGRRRRRSAGRGTGRGLSRASRAAFSRLRGHLQVGAHPRQVRPDAHRSSVERRRPGRHGRVAADAPPPPGRRPAPAAPRCYVPGGAGAPTAAARPSRTRTAAARRPPAGRRRGLHFPVAGSLGGVPSRASVGGVSGVRWRECRWRSAGGRTAHVAAAVATGAGGDEDQRRADRRHRPAGSSVRPRTARPRTARPRLRILGRAPRSARPRCGVLHTLQASTWEPPRTRGRRLVVDTSHRRDRTDRGSHAAARSGGAGAVVSQGRCRSRGAAGPGAI